MVLATGLGLAVPAAGAAPEPPEATTPATPSTISGDFLAPEPREPSTTTTSTTQLARVRGEEGLSEEAQIRLAMGALVAVAVVLAGATWWYIRATRPVPPPPGPAGPPAS